MTNSELRQWIADHPDFILKRDRVGFTFIPPGGNAPESHEPTSLDALMRRLEAANPAASAPETPAADDGGSDFGRTFVAKVAE
jgi:hypothetical protein